MYKILCEVSGGVMGYRRAYLKDRGVEMMFNTRAQAQKYADKHNERANENPHRTADFRYTVE